MYCSRCASVAAVPCSKAMLFKPCPAQQSASWKMPEASKPQLRRIMEGCHPDTKATKKGKNWPDGAPAARHRASFKVVQETPTAELQVTSSSSFLERPHLTKTAPSWLNGNSLCFLATGSSFSGLMDAQGDNWIDPAIPVPAPPLHMYQAACEATEHIAQADEPDDGCYDLSQLHAVGKGCMRARALEVALADEELMAKWRKLSWNVVRNSLRH